MGCDDNAIMDYLAQKSPAMARHCSRRADVSRKLAVVGGKFENELNISEQKLSNVRSGIVKS